MESRGNQQVIYDLRSEPPEPVNNGYFEPAVVSFSDLDSPKINWIEKKHPINQSH